MLNKITNGLAVVVKVLGLVIDFLDVVTKFLRDVKDGVAQWLEKLGSQENV